MGIRKIYCFLEDVMQKIKFVILIMVLVGILVGCGERKPLKVAVFTKLESGSIVGSSEIDGIKMFMDENNINDITIIPFNDGWDPDKIEEVYNEARKQGIQVFFTSHTSTCAVELKKLTDKEMDDVIVFISGSTTDLLSNLDDNNIRVVQDVISEQKSIAEEMNKYNFKKLVVFRDIDNYRYTDPAIKYFKEYYKGEIVVLDFSLSNIKINEMKTELESLSFDSVYTLIGGNQTVSGSIAQLAWRINPEVKVFFTPWSNATTLLETAGDAIDVCIMSNHFPFLGDEPSVKAYIDAFKSRYDYAPTYNSLNLHRTMTLLTEAMNAGNTKPADIKKYIIETSEFETKFGPIKISPSGDVDMPLYFITRIREAF